MRYLGIDYGTKKVGIALSDEAGTMGFPHGVLVHDAHLIDELTALIKSEQVGAVVIGESRDLAGAENTIAAAARELGDELLKRTEVPVHYELEMFTTQAARRFPDGSRMPGSPDVDASAAALILTSYFSRISPENNDQREADFPSEAGRRRTKRT